MLDLVCQTAIILTGVTGIFLVARKNKWGFVVGLASTPFWFITAYLNSQWGIFALNVAYMLNWIYGIYIWFWRDRKKIEINGQVPD